MKPLVKQTMAFDSAFSRFRIEDIILDDGSYSEQEKLTVENAASIMRANDQGVIVWSQGGFDRLKKMMLYQLAQYKDKSQGERYNNDEALVYAIAWAIVYSRLGPTEPGHWEFGRAHHILAIVKENEKATRGN